jgi:hypothetical protein
MTCAQHDGEQGPGMLVSWRPILGEYVAYPIFLPGVWQTRASRLAGSIRASMSLFTGW